MARDWMEKRALAAGYFVLAEQAARLGEPELAEIEARCRAARADVEETMPSYTGTWSPLPRDADGAEL
jgi:hypothetical protein